ncbi:uncharacterized protein JCM15063_005900 [Sporobolomyces koalae]|uniref:uncharacterized protein n=1 Tax=Sporobolomyces koalae TaxID=500713 RepID=UPI0031772BA5
MSSGATASFAAASTSNDRNERSSPLPDNAPSLQNSVEENKSNLNKRIRFDETQIQNAQPCPAPVALAARPTSALDPRGNLASTGVKKRKTEASILRFENDAKETYGFIGDMLSELKVKSNTIQHLERQLADSRSESERMLQARDNSKKELLTRARAALANVNEANQTLVRTSDDMRAAFMDRMTSEKSQSREDLAHIKQELDGLKAELDATVRSQLEKNEEARIVVLKELQGQLSNRDEVIKLLREDLETKTGQILEARDSIAALESQRQLLDVRLGTCSSDLESARSALAGERKRLGDRLDESLIAAREREREQGTKLAEFDSKWSALLMDARKGEDHARSETRDLIGKLAAKEDELRNELKHTQQQLESSQKNVEVSIDSAKESHQASQTSLRQARDQLEHLHLKHVLLFPVLVHTSLTFENRVSEKETEAQCYKAEINELQGRLATADALTTELETFRLANVQLQKANEELEVGQAAAVTAKSRTGQQLELLRIEKDELSAKVSQLDTSLTAAQVTNSGLQSRIADLCAQLSESRFAQSAQTTSLSELEAALSDNERIQKLEQELEDCQATAEREKTEYAASQVKRFRELWEDQAAIDKMEMQNKLKKTETLLQEKTRKLNKAQNDLATERRRPVLNPNSSSNGSTSGGIDKQAITACRSSPPEGVSVAENFAAENFAANLTDTSSLSPVETVAQVATEEAGVESPGLSKDSRPSVIVKKNRKRASDSTDVSDALMSEPARPETDKSTNKRSRRGAVDESESAREASSLYGGAITRTRAVPSKYYTTTKRKKK